MPQYIFKWHYKSNFGEWKKGDKVEFTEDEAAWLNRDSPGMLKTPSDKLTAAELIKAIAEIQDADELLALLEGEKRKTVLEAIQAQLDLLAVGTPPKATTAK
jgi:hypothetical protein